MKQQRPKAVETGPLYVLNARIEEENQFTKTLKKRGVPFPIAESENIVNM